VREGQHVREGDVLFRLDSTQAQANFDLQQHQLHAALAQEARLVAERDGRPEVTLPEELREVQRLPTVARAVADQIKEFNDRRASLAGQMELLEVKVGQYRTEIEGLAAEQTATRSQLQWIKQELSDLRYLLDRELVQKSRVLALEREKSRLEGAMGRSTADQAKAENGIGEAQLESRQLRQKFLEEVSGQMPPTISVDDSRHVTLVPCALPCLVESNRTAQRGRARSRRPRCGSRPAGTDAPSGTTDCRRD
jgi:multidrug efflux pump subunit AcrA (membrane-fusion protein)